MPSEKAFTLNKLLHRIEASKDSFSETFAPLTQAQIRKIQKVSAFIARPTGRHDSSRSVVVLTEIWNCTPQVFVLCALTNSPSKFFRLCREAYLQKLIAWWDRVDHPAGLAQILDKYAYILPPKRRSTTFKSGSLASPLEGTTCTDSPLGALHIPAERGIKAPEIDEAVAQLSTTSCLHTYSRLTSYRLCNRNTD
ncbi:hypothetical protein K491DRAFT_124953 [Lophiostoma macrostomum CBS 122681]|uniref:Uncharacterized protein n=1 Tax=Lophiostoma macrostomum CBS 122681 TaxID=1314788 RepID=A0A6A6SUD8_9PLEO|nr:hypothetical protein K491DRAFT_124953 [Lophiostoma macrostomum CBS 122681]